MIKPPAELLLDDELAELELPDPDPDPDPDPEPEPPDELPGASVPVGCVVTVPVPARPAWLSMPEHEELEDPL